MVNRVAVSKKLYLGLAALRLVAADSESGGDSRLVHHAGSNEGQDLALAGGRRILQ